MDGFLKGANDWLTAVASHADENYTIYRDFEHDGRSFPLVELMEIRSRHPVLSIHTGKGKWGVSREQCYFDFCESLDYKQLLDYLTFLKDIQEKDVDCRNPEHDYTFLSMVIVTAELTDSLLIRKIKRFRSEKQYHAYKGEYGWSSCKLCVFDLQSGQMICNAMGDNLMKRLSK